MDSIYLPAYQGQWQKDDELAVGPVNYCGVCNFCVSGKYEICENHREIAQAWPGGFAEYIAIPEDCVSRGAIRPVPEATADLSIIPLILPLFRISGLGGMIKAVKS